MDILCCRITIGDADPSNPMRIQNGVEITEVQSLEINESYKKLIGTAKVIFPKGSVCRSTIIGERDIGGQGRVEDNDGGDAGRCHHRETQRAASG